MEAVGEASAIIRWRRSAQSRAGAARREPCYVVRGQGCRVWDLDGNEYIDFRNALGPISLGYRFPAVDNAVRRQLENGIVFGYSSPLEVAVARHLVEIIPCAESVRFLKTGGEAMAAAIKLARAFTGRDLVLMCGYHGWLQTMGLGVRKRCSRSIARCPGATSVLRGGLRREGNRIAAVSVACAYAEAKQGHSFYPALRELTRKHGAC